MKNGIMIQYFEWNLPDTGDLWKRIKEDAEHLHNIGITSVWIPPAYKGKDRNDVGYAPYDLFDLGEFDQKDTVRTKYGTKQELIEMVQELHKYEISVYLDAVMNHKAGADYTEKFMAQEVDPKDRNKTVSEPYEIEGYTGFDFPGRGDKYSDFKWHWYHFSGTDHNAANKKNAIYKIVGEGKHWSVGVDGENGNYDYLLCEDIDLDHPDVIAELKKWGAWVSAELGLDGMRLDAVKHMNDNFVKVFLEHVRGARGEEFYAVGEYWNGEFESLENYLKNSGYSIDLFDVPLHYKMYAASEKGRDFDLTKFLDDTMVSRHPELCVTFVENHDTQQGGGLQSQVKDWFKPMAYGLIMLMDKGYPCIFYGDYYDVKGVPSPHRGLIDTLLQARRKYAYGEQHDYFDHPNTVGFSRRGDEFHPGSGLAMLINNGTDGDKVMYVGEEHAGQVWHEITGSIADEVAIGEDGNAKFTVKGGKLAVWVEKEADGKEGVDQKS